MQNADLLSANIVHYTLQTGFGVKPELQHRFPLPKLKTSPSFSYLAARERRKSTASSFPGRV